MMEPAKDWMRNNVSEPLDRACAGSFPRMPIDHSAETGPLPAHDFVPWRFSDARRGSARMVL